MMPKIPVRDESGTESRSLASEVTELEAPEDGDSVRISDADIPQDGGLAQVDNNFTYTEERQFDGSGEPAENNENFVSGQEVETGTTVSCDTNIQSNETESVLETTEVTPEPKRKKKVKNKRMSNVEDNDETVDVGDVSQLTEDSRNILFGRGLVYERDGKKNCALKCYLACLSHLTPHSNFVLLPQCLRNIADIYYRKEEYEKAILFVQAEKLYYENALVDTSEIQRKIEAVQKRGDNSDAPSSHEDAKLALDTLRAEEYEHLAKLCVDKKQPQLALEYAGKATKLRQKLHGNDSEITRQSLDFFATLYGEVGKQQYTDSISQMSDTTAENESATPSPPITPSMERSPSSILRQRKIGEDKEKKHVRFQETNTSTSSAETAREHEELISHTLLWTLFFICFLMLCVFGLWSYCSLTDAGVCRWVKGELQYFFMRLKYYYYQYASTKKIKYA